MAFNIKNTNDQEDNERLPRVIEEFLRHMLIPDCLVAEFCLSADCVQNLARAFFFCIACALCLCFSIYLYFLVFFFFVCVFLFIILRTFLMCATKLMPSTANKDLKK